MTEVMTEVRLTTDEFKFAFRGHPAGVGIVTADNGHGPVALTVSSLFSVGLEPPTLVFSASALSSATPTILNAETVVVHLVGADQVDLAKLGATSGVNRFGDNVEWDRLPTGEPYYPAAASWLRGRVKQIVPAGGSNLVVVEALEAKPQNSAEAMDLSPLVYHNRSWHTIGDHSKMPD
ncbi:flavin reductase family protein [Arthrobacter sp. K5]|uniref:Flavin reductase family protein n=1 Tax=Arthrobacter sp. K5 TaxID=2839623 RepID=A0AAU8EYU0_9MICC